MGSIEDHDPRRSRARHDANAPSARSRRALSDWAQSDPPEGFADAVIAAWLQMHEPSPSESAAPWGHLEPEPSSADHAHGGVEPQRSPTRSRVGLVAGLLAAAAVLLLVRALLPEPATAAAAHRCTHETGPAVGPIATAEPATSATSPVVSVLTEPTPELRRLAAKAVAALDHHCAPCHDATSPEAQTDALRVFDVTRAQWWLTMSDDQLVEARTRVQELGAADDDERRSMAAFVRAELDRRGRAG